MGTTEHRTTAQLKEQIVRLAQDWADALATIQACHQAEMRGVCAGCPVQFECRFGDVVEALSLQLRKRCAQLRQEESTSMAAQLTGGKP